MRRHDGKFPNIDAWLKEHRCTKKQLAEKMGIHPKTLWRLFSGAGAEVTHVHPYTRESLQRVTGMTYEEAFRPASEVHSND